MLTIEELLKAPLVTATESETVQEVSKRMADQGVGAVVVVSGEQLVGLFSERDLLTRVVAEGRDAAATSVGEVCTRELVTVPTDTPIKTCVEDLQTNDIRHLPVMYGSQPVGIISVRDFFKTVAGGLSRAINHARYDEQLREDFDPYDHLGGSYGR